MIVLCLSTGKGVIIAGLQHHPTNVIIFLIVNISYIPIYNMCRLKGVCGPDLDHEV